MEDLLSYSIGDFLMYSADTYHGLFALYNGALWPWPLVALAAAVGLVWSVLRPHRVTGWLVAAALVLAWAVSGGLYFHRHFASINWAADWFALAFGMQALMLLALWRWPDSRRWQVPPLQRQFGAGLFAVAAFLMPLQPLLGHRPLHEAELFGLAPDPTVVGTFGLLLCYRRARWVLFVIPALWAAVGGAFLYAMLNPLWWLMPASAVLALTVRGRERGGRMLY